MRKSTVSAGTSQTALGRSLTLELQSFPTWTRWFVQTAALQPDRGTSSAEHQAAGRVRASRSNIQSLVMLCFHYYWAAWWSNPRLLWNVKTSPRFRMFSPVLQSVSPLVWTSDSALGTSWHIQDNKNTEMLGNIQPWAFPANKWEEQKADFGKL